MKTTASGYTVLSAARTSRTHEAMRDRARSFIVERAFGQSTRISNRELKSHANHASSRKTGSNNRTISNRTTENIKAAHVLFQETLVEARQCFARRSACRN